MISLTDLTTPLTRQQIEQSCYDVLATLGVTTTAWKPGAVVRAMITAFALIMSYFSELIAAIASAGFLELASGQWLTLTAYYVYGVTRNAATFAAGAVTLVNTTGGLFTFNPGDLVVKNSSTGKTYRNTGTVTLNPLATLTDVAIEAREAGSASTSPPTFVDAVESGPAGVNVSNPAALVGTDDEADPALKVRCREKLGALSPNGPWDAYSFVARGAVRSDGTLIGVTRMKLIKDGFGNVDVYVATATGAVSGTVGNLATDLGAVDDAMQRQATPLCVRLNTHSAAALAVPVTYQAYAYNNSGLTAQQIKDTIATALASFFSTHPVGGKALDTGGGYVWADEIRAVIRAALPTYVFHVVLTLPSGDTALNINQVPTLGTVTGTITLVAPPDGGLL